MRKSGACMGVWERWPRVQASSKGFGAVVVWPRHVGAGWCRAWALLCCAEAGMRGKKGHAGDKGMREVQKGQSLGLARAESRPVGLGLLELNQRWPGPILGLKEKKGPMGLKLGLGP